MTSSVYAPAFRTPLTDLTGCIVSHQWDSKCAGFEMRAVDCLEAYGLNRGLEKCQDLLADFKECATREKQSSRYIAMRRERQRQYWMGERSKEERYAPPPRVDTY